jgi:hypothetical protein
MLLSGAQAFFWPGRPPVGWQPAWWQSQIWATIGFLMFIPSPVFVLLLQEVGGVTSSYLLIPAFFLGVALVVGLPTWIAFRATARLSTRRGSKA